MDEDQIADVVKHRAFEVSLGRAIEEECKIYYYDLPESIIRAATGAAVEVIYMGLGREVKITNGTSSVLPPSMTEPVSFNDSVDENEYRDIDKRPTMSASSREALGRRVWTACGG